MVSLTCPYLGFARAIEGIIKRRTEISDDSREVPTEFIMLTVSFNLVASTRHNVHLCHRRKSYLLTRAPPVVSTDPTPSKRKLDRSPLTRTQLILLLFFQLNITSR